MGKLEHGFNGPISGKVGNVVGSSWNGIPYIKARPKKREKPPTEMEKMNRHIFAYTQYWLKPLSEYVRAGFKNYRQTVAGINAAKSLLYERALIRDGYNSRVDPSLVLISFGNLPLSEGFAMHFDKATLEICISWNPELPVRQNGQRFAADQDQLMVVAYNIEDGETHGRVHGVFRREGQDRITIPSDLAATYHVYVAFISADRNSQSMSLYLGKVVYNG